MKTNLKTNRFMRSCSTSVSSCSAHLHPSISSQLLCSHQDLIKSGIVVIMQFSEKLGLKGATKYDSVQLLLQAIIKTSFNFEENLDILLITSFLTAIQKNQPPSKISEFNFQDLLHQAGLFYDLNQILLYQSDFLQLEISPPSETNPSSLLHNLAQTFNLESQFIALVQGFIDFALLEPEFALKPPLTFFYACILASFESFGKKPENLEQWVEMARKDEICRILGSDIIKKVYQLIGEEKKDS